MKRKLRLILGLTLVFGAGFVIWFIWNIVTDKPPQFFPFNELQGEYSIVRPYGSDIFMVKYKGPNAFSGISQDTDGTISVIVGKTKYDLHQYLGKKVFLTKGDFRGSFTTQCIANNCKEIGGPYVAVVIDEMEEIQEAKPRDKVIEYEVINGDSLEKIAEKFSISTHTIKWANNLSNEIVKPGQILTILPVSGVIHGVSKGETIYTIAQKYQTDAQKIIDFPYNSFRDDKYTLTPGQTIMVPDGMKP